MLPYRQGDMDDAQRRLQQQSLANVRALVEKIERDDRSWGVIGLRGALIAFAVLVAALAILASNTDTRAVVERAAQEAPSGDYVTGVIQRIATAPRPEILRGMSGSVDVVVMIRPDGSVDSVSVAGDGKGGEVDAAIVEMIRKLGPFPSVPRVLRRGNEPVRLALKLDRRSQ